MTHRRKLAKLCSSFVSIWSRYELDWISILLSDKTDKNDRLIHASNSKMAVKMNSVVKQRLYVLKLFRVNAGCIPSFQIRSIRFWI